MRIALGADHAGFALKEITKQHLVAAGHDVQDMGAHDPRPSDYADFAEAVGNAVSQGGAERGILICGSGVGAVVAANKIPGIRAGLCHDHYSAHQGVEHDAMNVLALDVVDTFLDARFSGDERHVRRLAKVRALEARWLRPRPAPGVDVPED